jgi:PAS domain S-box-containing protein
MEVRMSDEEKTKDRLIDDLNESRQRVEQLEAEVRQAQRDLENLPVLNALVETTTTGKVLFDLDGSLLFLNNAFAHLHGSTKEELLGKSISSCHAHDDKGLWEEACRLVLEKGGFEGEILHQSSDGRVFPCLVHVTPFKDPKGNPAGMVATVRDISARKQAESAFRQSEHEYREMVQNANSIIIRLDSEGRFTFANQFALDFFGYKEEELLGCYAVGTIIPETDLSGRDLASEIQELIEDPDRYVNHENENMRKNGDRVWVSWGNKALADVNGNIVGLLSVGNDVTERKRMEEELLRAKKLESLGILVGSISHDFNNILTDVFGNLDAAKQYVGLAQQVFDRLSEAEQASLRAKKLTSELLAFSKGIEPSEGGVPIADLIEDSASFILRGSNVVCDFSIQDDLLPVRFDEEMIVQVINTLIINAHQAMPDGGEVSLSAENIEITPDQRTPVSPGRYVKITVEDNGIGISKEYLPRIFDPYFTTKKERTGLGLATVYSIVKKHQGHITVESEEGKGTTFHIYLPAEQENTWTGLEEDEKTAPANKRVLVVDHDEGARIAVREFLTVLGCDTVFAHSEAEALEIYGKSMGTENPFHFVIVDASNTGPGDGRETVGRLRDLDRDVKAIAAGSTDDPVQHDFNGAVGKPYNIQDLKLAINKLF